MLVVNDPTQCRVAQKSGAQIKEGKGSKGGEVCGIMHERGEGKDSFY